MFYALKALSLITGRHITILRILYCILFSLFWVATIAQTQTENSIWYFGNSGIDFNGTPPTQLTDGKGFSNSSITDNKGNLVIYTDGKTVWNKNHNIIQNGTDIGVYSDFSYNQRFRPAKTIIVRQPQSDRYFYIFTADYAKNYYTSPRTPFIPIELNTDRENEGVHFSIVDMEADSGRGAVVQKNVLLFKGSTGKLAAAQINNSDNFWVVSLQELNDSTLLHAYSLTEKGLNIVSVITDVDMEWVSGGQIQFSFGATKLAISEQRQDYNKHFGDGQFCLFDFDTKTGKALNKKIISAKDSKADFNKTFGLEFSPDGRFIYANFDRSYHYITYTGLPISNYLFYTQSALYQVEVAKVGSFSTIDSVTILLDSANYGGNYKHGYNLRVGSNYKLYVNSLGYAIHQPNKKDTACNLSVAHEAWYNGGGGGSGIWGLPLLPKLNNYFLPKVISSHDVCVGDSTEIGIYNLMHDSISWDMGNGDKFVTQGIKFKYLYKDTGRYKIIARVFNGASQDTVSKNMRVYGIEKPTLGNDTLLCTGSKISLKAYHPTIDSYNWNTGSTDSIIEVKDKAEYVVYASNRLCKTSDTILIRNIFPCSLQAQNFCFNDSTLIEIKNNNLDSIKWDFGDGFFRTTLIPYTNYIFKNKGINIVEATLYYYGLQTTSTISINIHKVKKPNLGKDVLICLNDSLVLKQFDSSYSRYAWSSGTDDFDVTLKKGGTYWLKVEKNLCTNADTIVLRTINCGINAENFCFGDSTSIKLQTNEADSIFYDFGEGYTTLSKLTRQYYIYQKAKEHILKANLFKRGLSKEIALSINIVAVPGFDLGISRQVCEGSKLDPLIFEDDIRYNWNDSTITPTILINQSGRYKLTVSKGICQKTDSVDLVTTDCSCSVIFPNAYTPNNDNLNLNEYFMPTTECGVKQYELQIFNRWGQLIFKSNTIGYGWDGNYKGKPVPNGAYMWMARYKAVYTGKTYNQKGSITLLR